MNPYLKLLRPQHWVKSGFVFVGLLFGHVGPNLGLIERVVGAAAAFALAASSVYVLNDLVDRERDREHPEKRWRPLACGAVSPRRAVWLGIACLASALALACAASGTVLLIVALYVALNIGYSLGLKHVVLLDVFIISAGFILRLLAGTLGVGIEPSQWLFLCGLTLTLFLGFAKRRAELKVMEEDAGHHRKVLDEYDAVLLDKLIGICAACVIVSYSLYTLSPKTVAMHGTESLLYTVPCVVYGVFRYLFLLYRQGGGGDPAAMLFRDRHLLATFGTWLVAVIALLGFV